MNIGLDMMGGDQAPLEAVKGAVLYLNEKNSSVNLSLIGDKAQIDRLLADHQAPLERVQVIHAEQVIDMHDSPTRALKDKPRSSITIGFHRSSFIIMQVEHNNILPVPIMKRNYFNQRITKQMTYPCFNGSN